jgi:TolB protein
MEQKMRLNRNSRILWIGLFMISAAPAAAGNLGEFTGKTDVGRINNSGSAALDARQGTYILTGSGDNIWNDKDAFFYLWRKAGGDLALRTDITWEGKGKHAHRKAGWMIRAGLEADAAYVDAVAHGDGLISLQYRKNKGGTTQEVASPVKAPATMVLERTGDQFTLSVRKDGVLMPVGTVSVQLPEQCYAGLAVCSHDSTTLETEVFSGVKFAQSGLAALEKRAVESTLETIDITSGIRRIIRRAKEHFEAPNWSAADLIYYNSGGKIHTLALSGGEPKLLDTGFAVRCNNDHGLSPDGKELVISHHPEDGQSRIYILPAAGGEPRLVTPQGPSYWHGWSPDGALLAYCAERNGEFDVYTIPAAGGGEQRLTAAPGLDDGPDFSPDGQYIYFNSIRSGQMKIWRMRADGSEQIQFTPDDEYGDWFAHPSPDGKWLVFLSYDKSVEGHPANKDVVLRIMPAEGGELSILARFFGGQGTINVPSWSADSKHLAFVSYRMVKP